jgi:Flp pilus assembly protein CpaB
MKQKNVILMVVAVGCGLVAAFLTSQMSAKGQVEQVEVVVAAKDLPVGTVFTKDELKNLVKMKKVPKDGLPPVYVTNPDDLADKRLSRPIHAEETFNPGDLNKGIALPEGHDLVALSVGPSQAASGFVVPGCRVDVMASLRLGNTLKVFDLLVNTLVINVNHDMTNNKNGVYPDINQVGFALTKKEAVLLEMARARNCSLTLKLRNTNKPASADGSYNIDEVFKLLEDSQNPAVVKNGNNTERRPGGTVEAKPEVKPEVKPDPAKPSTPEPAPAPTIAMKKVLIAIRDIEPHTDVTNDLIKEAFELKEVPKDLGTDALDDLTEALGQQFKTGVAKGQWVTPAMVGIAPKPAPREDFVPAKPGETPVKPAPEPVKVAKRKFHDVAIHSVSGTIINRYEEVKPGQWRLVAVLTPEQAAQFDKAATKPEGKPEAKPEAKPEEPKAAPKVD